MPSLFAVYPTNDWHERETYDFFGIIFDGHPALTRIEMPDDWLGHPQRKDYPLGGIPVEYNGARDTAARRAEGLQLMSDHRGHLHVHAARTGTRSPRPPRENGEERIVVNMGPQHPSTHGVLRLILEIEGETVTEARCGIGYLHTGIEKNLEYRNWTQGVTFVTRMDYLSPFFNETAYCLGVEKLLDVTDDDPRARQRHPRDADGAQPDLLASGGAGHRRHGTGRDERDVLRVPRARSRSWRSSRRSPACG